MASFNGMTKRLRSWFTTDADCEPAQPVRQQRAAPSIMSTQEADRIFLGSIADLPADEQQKRIQKRQWYKRLARHQGIMEAEQRIDLYYESGSQGNRP